MRDLRYEPQDWRKAGCLGNLNPLDAERVNGLEVGGADTSKRKVVQVARHNAMAGTPVLGAAGMNQGGIVMRRLFAVLLVLLAGCRATAGAGLTSKSANFECPLTPLSQGTPPDPATAAFTSVWYGSSDLWAGLDRAYEGNWYSGPAGVKVLWFRVASGTLTVSGERLDQAGGPISTNIPEGYGQVGPQSSSITFPTEGCWKIEGHVDGSTLEFVVQVLPESKNPNR